MKFNILNDINIEIDIIKNEYNFNINELFLMAARKNLKRTFLFVSTVLGKHIPVNPKKSMLVGALLAAKMANKLDGMELETNLIVKALKDDKYIEKAWFNCRNNLILSKKSTLFVGFAETATALGNSVFSSFTGENIRYIHTTRDMIKEYKSVFSFDEEHSHAVEHFCYPNIRKSDNFINAFERIVLVDDEITTGNTVLNLIKSINSKYPNKEYIVISILDWRSKDWVDKFDKLKVELNIKITLVSIIKGEVKLENTNVLKEKSIYQNLIENDKKFNLKNVENFSVQIPNRYKKLTRILEDNKEKEYKYFMDTGRFGIDSYNNNKIEKIIDQKIKEIGRFETELLVLGTGEFMYLPMLLASKIPNARYQSTTRSPVYPKKQNDYGVKCASYFRNPFDKSVVNYIYNVEKGMYKQIVFVTEREIDEESKKEVIRIFKNLEIPNIIFIHF